MNAGVEGERSLAAENGTSMRDVELVSNGKPLLSTASH
jgi:hypothetical protein